MESISNSVIYDLCTSHKLKALFSTEIRRHNVKENAETFKISVPGIYVTRQTEQFPLLA